MITLMVSMSGILSATTPEGFDLAQTLVVALLPGIPLAFAVALVAYRFVNAAGDGDVATRMINATTSGLPASRQEWGAAMRAEVASIDDPRSRRVFAMGCVATSVRFSLTKEAWSAAVAAVAAVAALTLAASRVSLAGGRSGIMLATLYPPALVLFGTGLFTARLHRSFRSGLIGGALALVFSLTGMLAVAMMEGVHWQAVAGVFIMDGDPPRYGGIDPLRAALDPLSPFFMIIHLLVWVPCPILGAVLGGSIRGGDPSPVSAVGPG